MTQIFEEGGCQIRFDKKKYELPSCPRLDGFADHQSVIFKIIVRK